MLPGYVSGFYTEDECHIDLVRLAGFANARLVHAEASGVDTAAQEVALRGRPPLAYDLLSINTGITPVLSHVPGAAQHAVPVKPIDTFVRRFEGILERARAPGGGGGGGGGFRVAVVGAGPGGVELACALQFRLDAEMRAAGRAGSARVALVSRGRILSGLAPYARAAFLPLLAARGVELHEAPGGVASVGADGLTLAEGGTVPFDACLWCTQAGPAPWLAASGLPTDAAGFLALNDFLQADGGPPNVFGAGDAGSVTSHPRPKAGVYAVRAVRAARPPFPACVPRSPGDRRPCRSPTPPLSFDRGCWVQGGPLADNLRRYLEGAPLLPWAPQATHLNLITAGDRHAVGVKGRLGLQGGFLWALKDWIDRRFMAKYGADLDFSAASTRGGMGMAQGGGGGAGGAGALGAESLALVAAARGRCGGCGSKVGAPTLEAALRRLRAEGRLGASNEDVLVGLEAADDAAVLAAPPPGHVSVHTVDFFRAPLDDPFAFGAIAAAHALSDCHAMGAAPRAALAIAVLPFAAAPKVQADLYQLLAGGAAALAEAGCALVGGHTCEGAEMSLGFSVYGTARPEELLRRGGLRPGQALVLTKALGTGTVLAARMRGEAKGRWVAAAVDSMRRSNAPAAAALRRHGATACVDVTGFGLLGHAAEMAAASGAGVEVDAGAVPLLPGAVECAAGGALSSLHLENARAAGGAVANAGEAAAHPLWPLLLDPQTSGGLLAGVPADRVDACLEELRAAGCAEAAVVGRVVAAAGDGGGKLVAVKL
jgi:selenide,water dikinase